MVRIGVSTTDDGGWTRALGERHDDDDIVGGKEGLNRSGRIFMLGRRLRRGDIEVEAAAGTAEPGAARGGGGGLVGGEDGEGHIGCSRP